MENVQRPGLAAIVLGILAIAAGVFLFLHLVLIPLKQMLRQDHDVEVLEKMERLGKGSVLSWVEYRAASPGYFVQIIETSGNSDYAELSVSVCPSASGVDCFADEISSTRQKLDAPWDPVFCGATLCEDQATNREIILWAVAMVYKPEFIVDRYIPGLDAYNSKSFTQGERLTDSPAREAFPFYIIPSRVVV